MKSSWFFPSASADARDIAVVALSPAAARGINGLQGQVETIYRSVFASIGESEDRSSQIAEQNFQVSGDADANDLNRLVFAFYGSADALLTHETHVLGFSRVFATRGDMARVTCTSLAVRRSLEDDAVFEVSSALFEATHELGKVLADAIRPPEGADAKAAPAVDLWRSQYATVQRVKDLFTKRGYSTEKVERVELTKFLTVEQPTKDAVPEGIIVKPFDQHADDLAQIHQLWKLAFGGGAHPTIEAWKTHYLQTPRLAPELSFVAWDGNTPVSGVFLELIVDGEGGGEDEVPKMMNFSSGTTEAATTSPISLAFPEDYAERRAKIRATATSAYVRSRNGCGAPRQAACASLATEGHGTGSNPGLGEGLPRYQHVQYRRDQGLHCRRYGGDQPNGSWHHDHR